MTNLKSIEKIAEKFNNDVNALGLELKRVQSIKCRLKKQKGKSSYEKEMTEVISYEQVLKEARELLVPREKAVTMYEQNDVDILDYDETIKAIKSIQSKKCLSKWLTTVENDNETYRSACIIENMLLAHKEKLQPTQNKLVSYRDLQTVIDIAESSDCTKEKLIEMLKNLIIE